MLRRGKNAPGGGRVLARLARALDWLRKPAGWRLAPRDVGARGERAACAYLRKRGLRILERNARARGGEIDIVATEGSTLVFVEVKSRTGGAAMELTGLERIDGRKRAALRRASGAYRRAFGRAAESYRLDAVTVQFDDAGRVKEIRWHPAILDLDL